MGYMFLARYNAVTWMNAEEGEGRGGRGEGRGRGGEGEGRGGGGGGGGEGRCLSSLVFIITIFSSQEIHDSQRHLVLE